MHKVKDVVSKWFHPSFLFSSDNDADRSKRKRSDSIEDPNEEVTVTKVDDPSANGDDSTSKLKYHRSVIRNDASQLKDDDDDDDGDSDGDIISNERQSKRRRTATYQHLLSTERTSVSPSTTTSRIGSLSSRTTDHSSTITKTTSRLLDSDDYRHGSNRTYRSVFSELRFDSHSSKPNYEPSSSPLFSVSTPKTSTDTNLKSSESAPYYLLVTGLTNRSQSSAPPQRSSSATLTKPVGDNQNRSLSTERNIFTANYSSFQPHRLPYIERLRRRTLQDCVRLDQTPEPPPETQPTVESQTKSAAKTPATETKTAGRDFGAQCDIEILEEQVKSGKKIQQKSPASEVPKGTTISSIQTESSITIERAPVTDTFNITKPKVLGNVTPFSWPKFALAQAEFAAKNPDKCRVSTASLALNVSGASSKTIVNSSTSNTASSIPSFSSTLPIASKTTSESSWKCLTCTKENPIQTASCVLCHSINPNYKRPAPNEPLPKPIVKEPVVPIASESLSKSSGVTTSTNQTLPVLSIPTTTKESTLFPSFTTTTTASLITSNNTPITGVSTIAFPPFVPPTGKFNQSTTTASSNGTNTTVPLFGISTTAPLTTVVKDNPPLFSNFPKGPFGVSSMNTSSSPPNTNASFSSAELTVTQANPILSVAPSGLSRIPLFGTTGTTDQSSPPTFSNIFQARIASPPFGVLSSTGFATSVTSASESSTSSNMLNLPVTVTTVTSANGRFSSTVSSTPFASPTLGSGLSPPPPQTTTISSSSFPAPSLPSNSALFGNQSSSSSFNPFSNLTTTTASSNPFGSFTTSSFPSNPTPAPATTTNSSSIPFGSTNAPPLFPFTFGNPSATSFPQPTSIISSPPTGGFPFPTTTNAPPVPFIFGSPPSSAASFPPFPFSSPASTENSFLSGNNPTQSTNPSRMTDPNDDMSDRRIARAKRMRPHES